jgi:hypothetical protein
MKLTQVALSIAAASLSVAAFAQGKASEQMFPNARAGECYAKVFIPPTYTTDSQRILKRAAQERIEIIPARYETGEETVTVREASKKLEIVPATYETVEERVLVRPESKRLVEVPAVYGDETERVLKRAAYTTWKPGRNAAAGAGAGAKVRETRGSGEDILCLVEVPAEYETVTKRVMKTPPSTREEVIPAEYATVKKTVMKTPPSTREVVIPGETRTVKVTKLAAPASEKRVTIPEEYQTVTSTKLATEGRWEWRSILCDTNATRDTVVAIQNALTKAGFDPGPADGVIKSKTLSAVNAYQKAKGLPSDDYINMETVKSLGL